MWFLSQRSWLVGAALLATGAQAAGYEKVVTWSGKYVGIGGAAASSVQGSESLYFNPAGLASGGEQKWDASFNFSPTWAKFSGPVIKDDDVKQGNWKTLPIVSATVAYNVDSKFSVGTGFYVSGGAQAEYTGIDPVDRNPAFSHMGPKTVKTDLKIMEWGIGASYKIKPNWSVGVTWRPTFVNAAFSTFDFSSGAAYFNLKDLSTTKWNGFRLGTQYRSEDNKWGLGLSWRSSLTFLASGKVDGAVDTGAAVVTISEANASVTNAFPQQLSLGGDMVVGEHWTLFTEYVWTQYSLNKEIGLNGTVTIGVTPVELSTKNLKQNWRDQHNLRLATVYSGFENWPVRAGYVFTSAVIPKSTARASFPAPGIGNTFTLGTGHSIGPVDLNGALEYSFESATVAAGEGTVGAYNVKAWGLHLGASMKF